MLTQINPEPKSFCKPKLPESGGLGVQKPDRLVSSDSVMELHESDDMVAVLEELEQTLARLLGGCNHMRACSSPNMMERSYLEKSDLITYTSRRGS